MLYGGITISFAVYMSSIQLFFAFIILFFNKNINIEDIYFEMTVYRIYCYILSLMLSGAFILLIIYFKKHKEINMKKYKNVFVIYGITGTGVIISFQDELITYGKNGGFKNVFFILFFIFITIFMIISCIKNSWKEAEYCVQEMRNKLLEENFNEIKNMYQNYAYTYHDMKNHLIILEDFCTQAENVKAVQYIKSIRNPIDEIENYLKSGNQVLDIIINYKLSVAKKRNILTEVKINNLQELNMEENDICVIFSNLLDNAMEACELVPLGKRWIQIYLNLKGNMLIIKISNSYSGEYDENITEYKTLKQGFHGYGMKSVKARIDIYGGSISWKHKGENFVVTATLFT